MLFKKLGQAHMKKKNSAGVDARIKLLLFTAGGNVDCPAFWENAMNIPQKI